MPVVGVNRDRLFQALGRTYTDEEFDVLCFEYGIELDDVTSEKELLRKEKGDSEAIEGASEEVIYKIDIPANRYDMLCLEGIARALNVFKGRVAAPHYRLADMRGKPMQQVVVRPETALVRPYVVAAILRGVTFDAARYESFIDLQDKLHQNLCRQRSLVAIGTHDLSTVEGPFTYEALPPGDIRFVPLKQSREFRADELMEHYLANDQKLRRYVPLIRDSIVYPAIFDARRTLLSLPPIINGAHSAITLSTRDVFIECTATDLTKAKVVLNTVVCMFSEYCATPFEVEPVEVIDSFGESHVYPDLSPREVSVDPAYVNGVLGLELGGEEIARLLRSMQLDAQPSSSGGGGGAAPLSVRLPPTRSDVLHPCDVVEDAGIAYGFNNLPQHVPSTITAGRELPINQMTELLRGEMAAAGWTEVLTWALCPRFEVFEAMRLQEPPGGGAVSVGNPATAEFEVCRTALLPSALKTLGANKDAELPIKLFEISDAVLLAPERDVGARNERRLVAVVCNREAGFEVIHGLLNRIMDVLGVPLKGTPAASAPSAHPAYSWSPSAHPSFFPGRQAEVRFGADAVGTFGVVHPEVLAAFDVPNPVSALELNLEPFCFDQRGKSLLRRIDG